MTERSGRHESDGMADTISASVLRAGEKGIVREVRGGYGFVHRLAALGILPGRTLTVIKAGGPMIVEVQGQRLVLGRGMVDRVLVSPAGTSPTSGPQETL